MNPSVVLPPGVVNRIAEKTIELNFPKQVGERIPTGFWFGLTQLQEAQNGYDAAVTIGGTLYLFQYKVSTVCLRNGCRQFQVPHAQMEILKGQVKLPRKVFYVLPDVGLVNELAAYDWDLLRCTWLVDVNDLPDPVPTPTRRDGLPRLSGLHYMDLDAKNAPPHVVLHSDPVAVPALTTGRVFGEDIPIAARVAGNRPGVRDPLLDHFWAIREAIRFRGFGLVIP